MHGSYHGWFEAWTWASRPCNWSRWTRHCRNCRSSRCAWSRCLCARCGLGGWQCWCELANLFSSLGQFQPKNAIKYHNIPVLVECLDVPSIFGSVLSLSKRWGGRRGPLQVNLRRNMMPELRFSVKRMAFGAPKSRVLANYQY